MNAGLFMTGLASGFGKGISQGLEKYQTYLATSQLQEERARLEDKRLERLEGLAMAREQRGQEFELKRDASRQQHDTGLLQTRIGADIVGRAQDQTGRKDILKEQQEGEKSLLKDRIAADQQSDERKIKSMETIEDKKLRYGASEKAKERDAEAKRLQTEIGRDILLEGMRLDRAKSSNATAKLDPRIDGKLDIYKKQVDLLSDMVKSGLFSLEDVDKRLTSIKLEVNDLLGFEEKQRKPYSDPLAK